ncbi:acetyl-CoA carboxylase biotin carboxyl carrier protein subunit [bacterium DOLJORAL78_65_58]|nr:MAG: acetyl-CoA carboxylase biotin carboxyl carrier protein subunit [bacterium DOLZORAL124_64_63]PIE76485.1 MAG: acetyl-CoA carboxylase biotin carboxyl carrier protein subunit [bacterium DOLJORAL78_65_58]
MKLKITVHGVAYEVDVEVLDAGDGAMMQGGPLPPAPPASAGAAPATMAPPPAAPAAPAPAASSTSAEGGVASPIAGTVLELKCKPGDSVSQGQDLLVIEAMKMETAIAAPSAGTVKSVLVAAGDTVRENQTLVEFE